MESVAAEFAAGRNDTQADITTSFYFLVQEAIMAQLTLNYPNAVWS
jgi:hypothetical protein